MSNKSDRIKVAILKALHECGGPAGAAKINERLMTSGMSLQPRTIRFYLLQLDREGLTSFVSRRMGREITERGLEELAHANVIEKVGFIAAKVDSLGYQMTFNTRTGSGTIITNVSVVDRRVLGLALKEMELVFDRKLGMGTRLVLAEAGRKVGNCVVPAGMVAIGTVCSVTLNGIMLEEGIPVVSRFGGLVEMRGGQPVRFVELIEYAGTTVDPLEAFIKAGMTRIRECVRSGDGIVGASFREVPAVALEDVRRIHNEMVLRGLGGIIALGAPNRPLLDVPVAEGRAGLVVIGGLNPVAAVHEAGVRLTMASLAGLEDFTSFVSYKEVCRKYV
jgi:repressor of nif and glnA expression